METKYGFIIPIEVLLADKRRLINQIWKLIPMRENNEQWEEQLNTLIEEVCGLHEVLSGEPDFLILLSKLEGLKSEVCNDFMMYRKTVFRCIDLLTKSLEKYE